MIRPHLLAKHFLVYVFALILASCAGQQTTPSAPEESAKSETPKVTDTAKSAEVTEEKDIAPKEPEPPTIVTIPRRELEEPATALDPLAIEETESAEQKTPATAEVEAKAEEPVQKADVQTPVEQPAQPVDAPAEPAKQPEVMPEPAVVPPVMADKVEEPAKMAPPSTPTEQPIPTDPNTFIVTVGPKQAPHPSLGKGHTMGFLINGVSGKQLVLERGKTYTFDVQTDPKHDVYLSRKEIGWGASPITEGVTGAYTYKGKMTFTPSEATPDAVYYSCRNHPHMGALIQIVNPGEKGDIPAQTATTATPASQAATPQTEVSEAQVKQKLMFAEMMVNSQGAKRVSASDNAEAKELLEKAKSSLSEGREKSLVGALPEALAKADASLKFMSEATRLVPSGAELEQLKENYKLLLTEISDYQKSHKDNLERMERSGSVPDEVRYDEAKATNMMSEAKGLADKNNYVRANAILSDVQKTITLALHKMLDSQTIVYDLNFETAEDEYNYEYKRFVSYEELIPIAIEAKKPAPGAIKLMESFVEKARKRRDQAVAKAEAGEYPDAIAMLQQATKTIRRALRMVGVMQ